MNTKTLNFPAERFAFKYAGDEAEGIVDAIVNTTGIVDRQKDIVEPGAFRKALNGKMPKVVNSHQPTQFLGKVLSMAEHLPGSPSLPPSLLSRGLGGLAVRMKFNLETESGRDMFSNVKGGYVDEWSFMFSIADAQYDAKGIRHIKLVDEIFEVSPVLVGANQATLTLAAKSQRGGSSTRGYCLGCKSSVAIRGLHAITMSNGVRKSGGTCPRCSSRVYATSPMTFSELRKSLTQHEVSAAVARDAMYDLWVNGKIDFYPGPPATAPKPVDLGRLNYQDGTRFDH